jgi:hypothetical protein
LKKLLKFSSDADRFDSGIGAPVALATIVPVSVANAIVRTVFNTSPNS